MQKLLDSQRVCILKGLNTTVGPYVSICVIQTAKNGLSRCLYLLRDLCYLRDTPNRATKDNRTIALK